MPGTGRAGSPAPRGLVGPAGGCGPGPGMFVCGCLRKPEPGVSEGSPLGPTAGPRTDVDVRALPSGPGPGIWNQLGLRGGGQLPWLRRRLGWGRGPGGRGGGAGRRAAALCWKERECLSPGPRAPRAESGPGQARPPRAGDPRTHPEPRKGRSQARGLRAVRGSG